MCSFRKLLRVLVEGGHRAIIFNRIGGVDQNTIHSEGLHFRYTKKPNKHRIRKLFCVFFSEFRGFNIRLYMIFVLVQVLSVRQRVAKVRHSRFSLVVNSHIFVFVRFTNGYHWFVET